MAVAAGPPAVAPAAAASGVANLPVHCEVKAFRRHRNSRPARTFHRGLGTCGLCLSQYKASRRWEHADLMNSGSQRAGEREGQKRRLTAWDMLVKASVKPAAASPLVGESVGDAGDSNASRSEGGGKKDSYVIVSLGSLLRHVPLQRIAVWAAVGLTLFQLRDFVGVIMGTLVLSVVGNSLVASAEEYLPGRRRAIVAIMYGVIIAALIGIGVIYIPRLTQEGAKIIARIQQSEDPYGLVSDRLRSNLGEQVTEQLMRFLLVVAKPDTVVMESVAGSPTTLRSAALQQMIKDYSGSMVVWLATLISDTSRFALQSLVSLIFSFMLVWDMPAIKLSLQSLRESRLSIVYEEIAPVVGTFGHLFGKALQAQSAIAVVNTALTGLGLLLLRVSGVGLLSLLVFLCSFIPVAGVIMSTVPIGIVAFVESGILRLSLVVLMVVLIHAVEAYILNPVIYSAHLKLHPLLALAVLFFAEHALGVWGLLVAVPMAVFFSEYIIKRTPMSARSVNNSSASRTS